MKLTNKECKVLFRINEEEAVINQERFPEFPELTKEEIIKAIEKLKLERFIEINHKDKEILKTTDKGEQFILNYPKLFEDIKKEFAKNC